MPPEKKIVVIVPKNEREALRSCGVLPESCFKEISASSTSRDDDHFSPVCIWPYDIDYTNTAPLVEHLDKVQADVPAFLGLGIAATDEQLRENELAIESLFGAIIIHVVFLDDQTRERGYVKLKPFEEITEWAMNFRKAITHRFPNEYNVYFENHVLVLISRSNQISTNKEELKSFRACIGLPAGVFSSCYFMDYNLSIGKTSRIYFSTNVWSVMVSRLILACMLSLSSDIRPYFWQEQGIKVWTAQECLVGIENNSGKDVLDRAFAKTLRLIQEKVVNDYSRDDYNERLKTLWNPDSPNEEALGILKPDYAKQSANTLKSFLNWLTDDGGQPKWRTIPKGGWSDFNAQNCATETADAEGKHWKMDEVKDNYHKFVQDNPPQDFSRLVHELFDKIKRSSSLLFSSADILHGQMKEARNSQNDVSAEFEILADNEKKRLEIINCIKDEAIEMKRAQAHYVGYGVGVFITVAIALMTGWTVWRITQLLGGGVVMPVVLTGAIWGGSLGAMLTILLLHSKRGKKGVNHIIERSKEADKLMVERDQLARKILVQGTERREQLRINAIRFRVWALLTRTQKVLLTELQPHPTEILEALGNPSEQDDGKRKHAQREAYLAKTRTIIGPFPIIEANLMEEDIEKLARAWVFGDHEDTPFKGESFCQLWKRLCDEDRQNMGYYPAKLFINEIHSFVQRFFEALIMDIDRHILECNGRNIKEEYKKWYEAIRNERFARFATAAIGTMINGDFQLPCYIFANNDNCNYLNSLGEHGHRRTIVLYSKAMDRLPILALQYQEYCLDFDVTTDGLLTFKEVRNAW